MENNLKVFVDGVQCYFDDDWLDESFRPLIYMEQGFSLRE